MAAASAAMDDGARPAPARYDGFDEMPINGRWRRGGGRGVLEDTDPYSHQVLARIPLADERDLDEAFSAAADAQPAWYARLPRERAAVIRRAAEIEAGMTHVNDSPVNDLPTCPFGGEKNSGIGRYNGPWVIEELTTVHWVSVQHEPISYPF